MTFTDPEPTEVYDDCHTIEDIDARYKELFRSKCDDLGVNHRSLPIGPHDALMEDRRRACCRYYRERDGAQEPREGSPLHRTTRRATPDDPAQPRAPRRRSRSSANAVVVGDAETMVCEGCGEELPIKKFPTVKGKPGARETTCRECKKAGR